MKIAIFGLGYVGMTAAACLCHEGNTVLGVDPSDDKIGVVNSGRSPIVEPGIPEMVKKAVDTGLLTATHDAEPHLGSCRVAIVCVGTPSAPDGSHNMSYIADVSRQIAVICGKGRTEPLTVVYRSTFRPGTIDEIILPIFRDALGDKINLVELVYNPEFLRESTAVDDYFNPPKIVIGTEDGKSCASLDEMNANLKAPVFYAKYREAEITKFVDNTFHALKIAFANEVGRVCIRLGIDAKTVHKIFISDTKLNISPYYLRPGGAFGGSCLPKDVRALQHIAGDVGAHTHVVDSLIRSNEAHKHFLFENCTRDLEKGAKILMLGVSFKANSDDLRESPNIDLARKVLQAGFTLSIYDPDVEPAKLLGQNLGYAVSTLPALRRLLVTKETVESDMFDLVIDTRGWAKKLQPKSNRIVDINAL